MVTTTRLRQIEGDDLPVGVSAPPVAARQESEVAGNLLLLALSNLSKRTIVALASLVDLMLISTVFALLLMIIGSPTILQLVGAAGYALFVMSALWIRRGT